MTSQPTAELFQQVEADYHHYTKHARPVAPLVADRVLLKWYSLAVPERAHSAEEIDTAQAFILEEIESGRLALLDEAGFVVQHRVATADVFYVCSWNGNNELWETHYFRPLDTGEFEVGRHGTKFPTFCVWVLGIVHHETRAWSAYLSSDRDAASRAAWLEHVLDATVS
jgi:hypothetical protein